MRPVTKVLLVLAVVGLAVGVVWFASKKWGSPAGPSPSPTAQAPERPAYNDPLATYERWRQRLSGETERPGETAHRPNDVRSSSEHEGTVAAHRSETPVAGADPPGPTLRPGGVEGEVVTRPWRSREASSASNTYTIAQGDTLYGIATKHYGDARFAPLIEAANPGINPSRLRVGDRLVLPEKPAEKPRAAEGTPPAPAAPAAKVYVVQKNDTLIGISRRLYGDSTMYKKIYDANTDILSSPSATLHVGQKLRLPEP